ncbi:hypothetical protein HK105_209148 [Polyrhizophydium stewartii]|uniref:DUF885 domain-containing protein n=1 Tax=Polyrhizophydium stewartii TaxID=2732419 RepID=A0ABR4MVW0_9FUNG
MASTSACETATPSEATTTQHTHAQLIRHAMDKLVDELTKSQPIYGPAFDLKTDQSDIFHESKATVENTLRLQESLLVQLSAIDESALTPAELDEFNALVGAMESDIVSASTYQLEIPCTHMFGAFVGLDQALKNYHAINSAEDAENLKKRLLKFPERFAEVVERFCEGIAKGITLPAESINLMIGRVSSSVVEDPADSSFHKLFKDKIVAVGLPEDFLLDTIRESVVPAFKAVKDFLEADPHFITHTLGASRCANAGIFGLPDYERVYNDLIFVHTSARYTADELHQKGLDEVARIRKRMEAIKDKVFDGTLKEFFVALKDKERFPQLFFENEDAIVPHYNALIERIDKRMPQFFNKFPKFKCNVEAVPKEAEASAPGAYYEAGTADKAGTFHPNRLLAKDAPNHTAMALVLHEAIPGHHHQVSLSLEMPVSHVYMKMIFNTAFSEGWGLYAEYLGEEMGMYETDFDLFGRLEAEMFRALRLVVDTGLHTKNWTIEQCVAYMQDNLSMSDDKVLSEVKRYATDPGQALAYKVGEIKIVELRRKAEDALGGKFDIRAFHDVVLDHGSVRLDVLEKNVDEWIAGVLAQTAAA